MKIVRDVQQATNDEVGDAASQWLTTAYGMLFFLT
jgi:hypothetical protein